MKLEARNLTIPVLIPFVATLTPPGQDSPRKFSTVIMRMVVELDRDPALYADGDIVEVSCAHTTPHYFFSGH